MKEIKVFKTPDSQRAMETWYDKFLQALPYTPLVRKINTSFGWSEALVSLEDEISDEQPPIVLLHGAMAGAPHALGEILDYPTKRRIIAVNVPGQSPRTSPTRLNFKKGEYGQWFAEVLNQLGVSRAILTGVSWGGSASLHIARTHPQLLAGLILVVPGSLVAGSQWQAFKKVGWPMIRYKLSKTPQNLGKALENIFTTEDDMWTPYLADAMDCYHMDFSIPPLIKDHDLAKLSAPTYVIAADKDIYFPGDKVLARAKQIFPNLVGTHLLRDSHHSPPTTPEGRAAFTVLYSKAVQTVLDSID